jgi:hypothetical protein
MRSIPSFSACLSKILRGKNSTTKFVFWGEIDRQYIQVFGTSEEMRAAVHARVAGAFLKYGKTGFPAQCAYTLKAREANKAAEFDEWNKINGELLLKNIDTRATRRK